MTYAISNQIVNDFLRLRKSQVLFNITLEIFNWIIFQNERLSKLLPSVCKLGNAVLVLLTKIVIYLILLKFVKTQSSLPHYIINVMKNGAINYFFRYLKVLKLLTLAETFFYEVNIIKVSNSIV